MKLTNGATPIKWEIQVGGNGLRNYVGKVIATDFSAHKYVVWTAFSDDGINFDCENGSYVNDYNEAHMIYASKADWGTHYDGRDELAGDLRRKLQVQALTDGAGNFL